MKKTGLDISERAKKIKLILLDVDGVMTDGSIILDSTGTEIKAFHVRDGHGIKMAQKAGLIIGIITGRNSKVVNIRARELGITEVYQGTVDKGIVYAGIIAKYGLADEDVAFIGDDIVDIPILRRVGLAVAVADADPGIRPYVHMITKSEGGRGAVREFINFVLSTQGKLGIS